MMVVSVASYGGPALKPQDNSMDASFDYFQMQMQLWQILSWHLKKKESKVQCRLFIAKLII